MKQQDKKDFAVLMTSTGEMYSKEISTDLIKLYYEILINYSINDVKKGFSKHILNPKHGSFFPKPADITRNIKTFEIAVEAKAEMAWAEILNKISTVGSYNQLEMEDKQALATVKALGGWKRLCFNTTEQLVWAKKEFISIYENYESIPIESLPHSLPGRIELEQHKTTDSKFIKQLAHKASMAKYKE